MLTEEERERIRRAFHLEQKSIYWMAREEGYSRQTVEKVVAGASPQPYQLTHPRPVPVFGPYQPRVEALLRQNDYLPRKIFELLQEEGYQGSASHIRQYLTAYKQATQTPEVFLPLEFEPAQDTQVDWGEAFAIIGGQRRKVQVFLMHLCYSRRTFAIAFPSQAQEWFFWGHVQAFKYFGGVLHQST